MGALRRRGLTVRVSTHRNRARGRQRPSGHPATIVIEIYLLRLCLSVARL